MPQPSFFPDQHLRLVEKEIMENAAMPAIEMDVPLIVDAGQGRNWAEAH